MIGMGTMGVPMTRRLAEQGLDVRTWSRSGRVVEGVASSPDLPGAVADRDVVILSLADDVAVREVVARLRLPGTTPPGSCVVDTSTVSPSRRGPRASVCSTPPSPVGLPGRGQDG